jgi:5,5'-dehydrodivanillate O-demethylase oxygenase subunit
MISTELNDRLTQVGPGTPMGSLQRQYWHPVATEASLRRDPIQRVRILGEDLVLFMDLSGRAGLVPERCPHRGASLGYGFPEVEGIRCPYHGWLFSTEGECLEQPNQTNDLPRFRQECHIKGYKVELMGGLVFAYLGPDPVPQLPPWDLLTLEESRTRFRDIGSAVVPCNWLQIAENSLDPTHVEWLHGRLFNYHLQRAGEEPSPVLGGHHIKLGFDPFEYGIIKRRLREGQTEEDEDWRIGHPLVFPAMLKVGGKFLSSFQLRTPVDDEHTLYFWYCWYDVPDGYEDVVEEVRALPGDYPVQVVKPDGTFSLAHIDSQDVMAWASQGARTDRAGEHLSQGDRGVVMYRKLLEDQLDRHEAGEDPMNVFRKPFDGPLELPLEHKEIGIGGDGGNPLASFLRTQALDSPRLTAAVASLDRRLGIEGDRAEIGDGW